VRHETGMVKRRRWPVAGGSRRAVAAATEPNTTGLTGLTPSLLSELETHEKAGPACLLLGRLGYVEKMRMWSLGRKKGGGGLGRLQKIGPKALQGFKIICHFPNLFRICKSF
jgi:hypothetical protein